MWPLENGEIKKQKIKKNLVLVWLYVATAMCLKQEQGNKREDKGQKNSTHSLTHLSDVGVGRLGVDASVLLHVPEGVGHVTSSAAVVLRHAVHQVLRTEVHQLTRLLGQLALQGPGRAEGPAGSAGALWGEKDEK